MKKLLIIEGNTDQDSMNIETFKGLSYVSLFTKALESIGNYEIDALYPTRTSFKQVSSEELKKYDGILWTGSALSVNEDSEFVKAQIELCKNAFSSQTPIYGSCWGLQVAVIVAGGKVSMSKEGYEIGLVKDLQITKEGKKHFLYKNRTNDISSYCVHKDYISQLPKNSLLLSFNEACAVQALEIKHNGGIFVGVQYHPEFDLKQMISTYNRLYETLLKSEYFKNKEEFKKELKLVKEKNINNNEKYFFLEIQNWIETL